MYTNAQFDNTNGCDIACMATSCSKGQVQIFTLSATIPRIPCSSSLSLSPYKCHSLCTTKDRHYKSSLQAGIQVYMYMHMYGRMADMYAAASIAQQ